MANNLNTVMTRDEAIEICRRFLAKKFSQALSRQRKHPSKKRELKLSAHVCKTKTPEEIQEAMAAIGRAECGSLEQATLCRGARPIPLQPIKACRASPLVA